MAWLNVLFASMEITNFAPQLVVARREIEPVLGIRIAAGQVVLEWPAGTSGWTLQQAGSPGGPWAASTEPVSPVDGKWRVIQAPAAGGRRFFRLAKP
jgi:hypothetical protein